MKKSNTEIKLKIILLGNVSCGKTSIFNRIKHNYFHNMYSSTIGVDFCKYDYKYDNKQFNLHIWDTSGQEKFNNIISSYYRNITAAIIVFDLTDITSFNNIKKWIDELSFYANDEVEILIVGNKNDLKKNIIVTEEMIKNVINNEYNYISVSAKEDESLVHIFDPIVYSINKKIIENTIIPDNNKNGITIKIYNQFEFEDQETKIIKKTGCCNIL